MNRGAWRLTVHVVAKSWIQLSDWAHEVADHIILMGLTRISSINLIICIIQRLPRTFFITLSKELFIRYCRRKTSLDLGQKKNGSSCPEFWKPEANIDLLFRVSGTVQKCILTFIQKYLLSTYCVPDSLGSRNTVMSKTGDISAFTDLEPSGKEEMIQQAIVVTKQWHRMSQKQMLGT